MSEKNFRSVGKSFKRIDGVEKITGRAMFTDDYLLNDTLIAKIVHSEIANGVVKNIDIEEALKIPGVEKIVTCFDVPKTKFPTAGHPWSTDPSHQDIADNNLLTSRVRFYGDNVAAVIATDSVACDRAIRAIKIEYEEYTPLITPSAAMAAKDIPPIHEDFKDNILAATSYEFGDFNEAIKEPGLIKFEDEFKTPIVQHCHIENPICYAYQHRGRMVVVSSTQIPHIVRRVVGQALDMPWGKIRVIKPFIGGGFGNKQDVLFEPLCAYLSTVVGGRCVKIDTTREETFACTRVRHAIDFKITSYVRPDGRFVARALEGVSNQGGYASHGHGIVAKASSVFRNVYQDEKATKGDVKTVFTNTAPAGAMRGYGVPQIIFAMESHVDDIAKSLNIDPVKIREINMMKKGYIEPYSKVEAVSVGLPEAIEKGKAHIDWDKKRKLYENQSGNIRKGVGCAIFTYQTAVWPISIEVSSCRMSMNQDGTVQLIMGATEIGQGADTVFCQMASEATGIPFEDFHIMSNQDTDISPYDPGAYASRQSYVGGMAIKKTADILKQKIFEYAEFYKGVKSTELDIDGRNVINKLSGEEVVSLAELMTEAYYNPKNPQHIEAYSTANCQSNTFAVGACFADVEVDISLGTIEVKDIINVHDSGKILNPMLAEMQVHGGMSMGLGYGLSEQLLYNEKTGKPLNNNLLDYKLMTTLDTPDLSVAFVEPYDITGPFGNKSLGEPPTVPVAAAIRNAVLNATGVKFNQNPLTPERVLEGFRNEGLVKNYV